MTRTTFAQEPDGLFLDAIFCTDVVAQARRTTELLHQRSDVVEMVESNPFTVGSTHVTAHTHRTACREPGRQWYGFRPVLGPTQCAWMPRQHHPFETFLLGIPESATVGLATALRRERPETLHIRKLVLAIEVIHRRGDVTGTVRVGEC